jgi:propanol-preferring alcohol dehydrogenase
MRAYRYEGQGVARLSAVPTPEPGPGEVLVEVAAVGACHTDLTILDAPPGGFAPPSAFTLGHETSGWVAALGAGVTGLDVGQPVLVYISWGCGSCPPCLQGLDHWCERGAVLAGLGHDGGLADHQLVPDARFIVPLPDGIDVHEAAPLADAGLTPYHAIGRSIDQIASARSTVVILGVGGLGHVAVQIAKALSPATVVALDVSAERLELAKSLGADHAIAAGPQAAAQVLELTRGRGADLLVDFVGSDSSLQFCADAAGHRGQITLIGGPAGSLQVNHSNLKRDTTVTRSGMGSIPELHEVVALAATGAIRVTTEMHGFDQIDTAYGRLRDGQVTGRAVIRVNEQPSKRRTA